MERKFFVTSDLDGVQFHAPVPLATTFQLLKGRLVLPQEREVYPPDNHALGLAAIVKSIINSVYHEIRPVDRVGKDTLEWFRDIGFNYGIQISFAALTGRHGKYLQAMTMRKLRDTGYDEIFDRYYFADVKSSSGYKEKIVRELLKEDTERYVVYLEDDVRAALCVARTDHQKVIVYLKNNLSNHPRLLKRANVELPSNVINVSNFDQAIDDFVSRFVKKAA